MERIKLIEHVTFCCTYCKTSIKFEVPNPGQDTTIDMGKLEMAIQSLRCPKCQASLGVGASKMLDFIKSYNAAAIPLNIGIEHGTIKID